MSQATGEGGVLKLLRHCPCLNLAKMAGVDEKEKSRVILLQEEVALGKRQIEQKTEMKQAERKKARR